ncbi:MAG TPA: hypothetical protein VGG14_13795, partial [Candidatus Sulfotelmatobacter sp.]
LDDPISGRSMGSTIESPHQSQCVQLRWFFRCLTVALGFTQIVLARNTVGPDARSYLEIARAILRGDWAMVINAYWSVLYPWMLAPMLAILRPSLRWEFPVAHLLAFPVLLLCIWAFEFFWSSLLQLRESGERYAGYIAPIPAWQFWVLGYSFLIWLVVGDLITAINPDLSMTTIALFSAGLVNRIVLARQTKAGPYLWFGACLGLGYLTKAVLFPMGFVFLGVTALVLWRFSLLQARKRLLAAAALIFVCISLPEIALLSNAKHRLTFSDAGKLNFAWYTYNLPQRNWQGEPRWSGTPVHPTRKIFEHPAVYEFNGPLRSSYPPWYDPSYWNEGLSPTFQAKVVTKHVLAQTAKLAEILRHPTAWIVGIALIFLMADWVGTWKGIATARYLLLISALALAAHCVTLLESRYLGPWEILLWGALLAGIRLRAGMARWCGLIAVLVSLALIGAMVNLERGEATHGFHNYAGAEYAIAEGLQKTGLPKGTRVAAIGFDNDAYWPYLLRWNVVAEIETDETCRFWGEPAEVQQRVMEKFAQAGSEVVVVNAGDGIRTTSRAIPLDLPGCARPGVGWQQVPGSSDYVFFLR